MSKKKITIRLENKDDYRTVENLTREAFWNVYRPGCLEHYVLHCFREDPAFVPELDFVMEADGERMGQIIYVRSEINCDDERKIPIMTFGPISIAPSYKRQGYGKRLLDYSMEQAERMGAGALAITGNIDFYGKSGFVPAKTKGIRYADDPEADYFLIKELIPGFLEGISGSYRDPEGYFVCEKDPEGFEQFLLLFRQNRSKNCRAAVLKNGCRKTREPLEQTCRNEADLLTGCRAVCTITKHISGGKVCDMKPMENDWYKKIWTLDIQNQSWTEDTKKQVDFVIEKLHLHGGEKVLDLACGFGRHSLELARRGFSVTGIDITPSYIHFAEEEAQKEAVRIFYVVTYGRSGSIRNLMLC